jgi:chromosome partitioning protein
MYVVGLVKQKGGAGATTLAVHLAIAARDAGLRVCIVDVDPQRSASSWRAARESEDPPVVAVDVDQLADVIAAARDDEYDLVLIDTPPHSSAATAAVARQSDLAVIPTRPGPLDLAAMPAMLQIVQATRTRSLIVLNACPPRAPEVEQAREVLSQTSDVPVWSGQIGERRVYSRAISHGLAVTEIGTDEKANTEVRKLWADVAHMLAN